MGVEQSKQNKEIPFNGRLITSVDPVEIGENFSTLKNLRYTEANVKCIAGMSAINTNALAYPNVRTAFHFRKELPSHESHVLVNANNGSTESKVYDLTTEPPGTGDFSATVLNTTTWPVVDHEHYNGCFSSAPYGNVVFTNASNSLIWGGNESKIGAFLNRTQTSGTEDANVVYDFTQELTNGLSDAANTITIRQNADTNDIARLYIGTTRPVKGFKFYVGTGNTTSSRTLTVSYKNTSGVWTAISSITDNTDALNKTGTVTFATTESTATAFVYNGLFLYWYLVLVTNIASTTLYQVTCDMPMQQIKDLWDGVERTPLSCLVWDSSSSQYQDYTLSILSNDYSSTITESYVPITGLTDSEALVLGFSERMAAVRFVVPEDTVNTTSRTLTVKYWNGAAWTAAGWTADGTSVGGKTFATTGVVSRLPPDEATERKRELDGNGIPLYYYQFVPSGALSAAATVAVDYATGIPAQKTIKGFSSCLFALNRVFLIDEYGSRRNVVISCAQDAPDVWNGDDSGEIYFGDERPVTGGAWIYAQFGSSLYNAIAFFKQSETWLLTGNGPDDWEKYRVSSTIGCPSPKTIVVVNPPSEMYQQANRTVCIFSSYDGIYIFDGKSFIPIHEDIKDIFDPANTTTGMFHDTSNVSTGWDRAHGFYDHTRHEYHWIYYLTDTTMREMVYDMRRKKWYEADRGASYRLTCGHTVHDIKGRPHNYGYINSGYCYRLENGQTMAGNAITWEVKTGHISLTGSMWKVTKPRHVMLYANALSNTHTGTMTHYKDSATSGTDYTLSLNESGKTLCNPKVSANFGDATLHQFKFAGSASNETVPFQPKFLSILYNVVRDDTK